MSPEAGTRRAPRHFRDGSRERFRDRGATRLADRRRRGHCGRLQIEGRVCSWERMSLALQRHLRVGFGPRFPAHQFRCRLAFPPHKVSVRRGLRRVIAAIEAKARTGRGWFSVRPTAMGVLFHDHTREHLLNLFRNRVCNVDSRVSLLHGKRCPGVQLV